MNINKYIVLLAAATAVVSCSDESLYNNAELLTDTIEFTSGSGDTRASGTAGTQHIGTTMMESATGDTLYVIAQSQDWDVAMPAATRANEGVAETEADNISNFLATCVRRYPDTSTPSNYYFQQQPYQKDGSGIFGHANNLIYYWAGTAQERYDFYVTDLRGATGATVTTATDAASDTPITIEYTLPTTISQQRDMVYAKYLDAPANWGRVVPLDFHHALTAIRFQAAEDILPGTVTGITITNVKNHGTLHIYNTVSQTDMWRNVSGAVTYNIEPGKYVSAGANGDQTVTPDNCIATFMGMPQVLDNVEITVNFTDQITNTARTFTASLAGGLWPMGKVVTYIISTSSITQTNTFQVTSSSAPVPWQGGTTQFSVTSYTSLEGGGTTGTFAVPWTAELVHEVDGQWVAYADDDPEKPTWVNLGAAEGSGHKTDAQSITFSENFQRGRVPGNGDADPDEHQVELQRATPLGSEISPYDLSTKGGTTTENTANCYIVSAPGTYSFPLVYGNAIKNGATNSAAYSFSPDMGDWITPYSTAGASQGGYLANFIDANGNAISSPDIDNVAEAVLVWSNEDGVISDLKIEDGKVVFTVPQEKITQNNAIIAARDNNGKILWSWHIWITDEASLTTKQVVGNQWYDVSGTSGSYSWTVNDAWTQAENTNIFMDINLGYRHACNLVHDSREVNIRFKQTGTGEEQVVTVTQNGGTSTRAEQTMYYQWGRKDPIPEFGGAPAATAAAEVKNLYPFYYNGYAYARLSEGSASNPSSKGYAEYTQRPDQMLYYTPFPTFWNSWNNAAPVTYAPSTVQNDLSSYYINSLISVVKTVYDPSPVGYNVMPAYSMSGFTYMGLSYGTGTSAPSGGSVSWTNNINNTPLTGQPSSTATLSFYCGAMTESGSKTDSEQTIDFPSLGSISSTGVNKTYGWYWTANKSRYMVDSEGAIADTYTSACLFGFGVVNTDFTNTYIFTVRNQTAYAHRRACAVRCTAEK